MRPRIVEVDVLRGFALFGISIVNTVGISGHAGLGTPAAATSDGAAYWAYETLLHQRFFPIFSFLFGISFGLFLDAAREAERDPRLVMLARLGFLVPIGALHRLLQPDEVLLSYAVVGVVVLLPASFLAARYVLVLGAAGVLAAVLVSGGGSVLIPGLFLLGYAAQRYGVEKLLDVLSGVRLGVALAIGFLCAVVLNFWQVSDGASGGARVAAVAGLATAAAYVMAILLLSRSRVRGALGALAPLGRMALSGYVGATLMIMAADDFVEVSDHGTAVLLGTCVFLAELAFSSLWLRHARYGPLEWVWRSLTWWEVVPNRRQRVSATGSSTTGDGPSPSGGGGRRGGGGGG
ncbi:DUF418 domain-containing protein [Actinomadura sp. KC216]|uniref:DUF418 domain-containing protein n=1 Tax=Actinomadura sp. KC216 TaxID=2530370 RepID=UPI001FB857B7|nr:DUF418 domain-containing protein [Actinomadura sp. KC216]